MERKTRCYTVFVAASASGRVSQVRIPFFTIQVLALLVGIGGTSVIAGVSSYVRILWKVADYNSLREEQSLLKRQYGQLQTQMGNTHQHLDALQSLATQMTMAYGVTSNSHVPFQPSMQEPGAESTSSFRQSVEEFEYLRWIPFASGRSGDGSWLSSMSQSSILEFIPSLWPVQGRITAYFGERLDPFSGEGTFHTGVDIASHYGDEIHAAAEGTVIFAGEQSGYGNVVIIDHGFGYSTLYAHLSRFRTQAGASVNRGDVIGDEGQSGRATGPHLHYEVRVNNEPVNPWRYLRALSIPHSSDDGTAD
jgi:murein DD-endopeptidase MepM/ murein hydrolase activator NlpD